MKFHLKICLNGLKMYGIEDSASLETIDIVMKMKKLPLSRIQSTVSTPASTLSKQPKNRNNNCQSIRGNKNYSDHNFRHRSQLYTNANFHHGSQTYSNTNFHHRSQSAQFKLLSFLRTKL